MNDLDVEEDKDKDIEEVRQRKISRRIWKGSGLSTLPLL